MTVGGYSSYDEYAGKNGRSGGATEANKLDAETVYALSAKINVTSELIANAHYSKSLSYSYDGSATTFSGNSVSIGNKTGQSWAKHTLTASCTFDGVTGNASREFHITGLPYRVSPPTNSGSHPWSAMEGRITWESNRVDLFYSAANYPRIGSPTFYIPADINVNMSTKVVKNNSGLNGPLRITLQDDNHKLYDSTLKKNATYESTISTTMTTSLKQFRIQYRYMASGPHTYVYYFNVLYR